MVAAGVNPISSRIAFDAAVSSSSSAPSLPDGDRSPAAERRARLPCQDPQVALQVTRHRRVEPVATCAKVVEPGAHVSPSSPIASRHTSATPSSSSSICRPRRGKANGTHASPKHCSCLCQRRDEHHIAPLSAPDRTPCPVPGRIRPTRSLWLATLIAHRSALISEVVARCQRVASVAVDSAVAAADADSVSGGR